MTLQTLHVREIVEKLQKNKRKKQGYLIHTLSDTALRGTVVNRTLYNLCRGTAEIMLRVPLTQILF